jgi:Domain of unknown function (DUF4331)
MKTINIKVIGFALLSISTLFVGCSNDESTNSEISSKRGKGPYGVNFEGIFVQQDQMARPAINTVFIASGTPKDAFNEAIPSAMGASYQSIFESRLLALNSGYTTNALGQTAAQLTGLLATDVLNVSKTAPTTFFDGTNVLTGRNASDDVIDVELLLIFGGPDGTSNPTLTKDNVDSNDKTFSTSFPYLASAW